MTSLTELLGICLPADRFESDWPSHRLQRDLAALRLVSNSARTRNRTPAPTTSVPQTWPTAPGASGNTTDAAPTAIDAAPALQAEILQPFVFKQASTPTSTMPMAAAAISAKRSAW